MAKKPAPNYGHISVKVTTAIYEGTMAEADARAYFEIRPPAGD